MVVQGNDDAPTFAMIVILLFCLEFILSCLYKYALVKLWRLWKRKTQKKKSEPEPEPKAWQTHPMQLFRIIRQDKKRVSGLLFAVFKYDCVDDVRTYGATLVRLAGLSIQADGGEIQLDGWINTKVDIEAQKVKTFCRDFYRDYYWKFCTQQNIDGDDVRAMLHPRRLAICGAPVGVDAAAATEATIAATTTDAAADTVADATEATIAAATSDATTAVTDTATEATIAATTTDAAADTVADATIAAVTSDATTAVTDTATEATIAAATSDATTVVTDSAVTDTFDAVATTVTPSSSPDASPTPSSVATNTPLHILLGCDKSPHVPYLWATGLAVCLITRFIRH